MEFNMDASQFNGCASSMDIVNSQQVSITHTQINNSTIPQGSAFFVTMISLDTVNSVSMQNIQINNNKVYGGISLSNCVVAQLSYLQMASNDYDYSILVRSSQVILSQISITDNVNKAAIIDVDFDCYVDLNFSQILNNGPSEYGLLVGANSTFTIANTVVAGNHVVNGGAVGVTGNGILQALTSKFHNNIASSQGGALWASQGTLSLNDVTIANNTANTGGAGWCDQSQVTFTQIGCTWQDNVSTDGSKPLQC